MDSYKIVGLSIVKNEQDIIEPFIRHNTRFVDYMVIMDNGSVDATRQIAMNCAAELGRVIVGDDHSFGHLQEQRITRLLHYCQSAFFADFIVLLDADEFIGVPDRQTLIRALEKIPDGGMGLTPWRSYVLHPDMISHAALDPPRSMIWRRTLELPLFEKAVLRLNGAHRPDLQIAPGNHSVISISGRDIPTIHLSDVPLLHFPIRSRDQIISKSVAGWMAFLAKNPKARDGCEAKQWQVAFDRIASADSMPNDSELAHMSMNYAQHRTTIDWDSDIVCDQPAFDYIRAYSNGAFANPIALIARSWEKSLTESPLNLGLERPDPITRHFSAPPDIDPAWYWDHLFVDVAPFRYMAEKHRPDNVLEIGCGVGAHLVVIAQTGAKSVLGIDRLPPDMTALTADQYRCQDLAQPFQLDRKFDIVICSEVIHRLPVADQKTLFENIVRHTQGMIIFSAAEPGQPGNDAFVNMPFAYWLDCWSDRGWIPDLADTMAMRALATLSWLRRNLVVLRPGTQAEGVFASETLKSIAARRFFWFAQSTGIRQIPFFESFPPPPFGYEAG